MREPTICEECGRVSHELHFVQQFWYLCPDCYITWEEVNQAWAKFNEREATARFLLKDTPCRDPEADLNTFYRCYCSDPQCGRPPAELLEEQLVLDFHPDHGDCPCRQKK